MDSERVIADSIAGSESYPLASRARLLANKSLLFVRHVSRLITLVGYIPLLLDTWHHELAAMEALDSITQIPTI